MSPVGGPGSRRLRGAPGLEVVQANCTCGEIYMVSASAIGKARCRNKKCRKPTRDLPDLS